MPQNPLRPMELGALGRRSVAIRGERGNYNHNGGLLMLLVSVAIRGERGNYNVFALFKKHECSVAIRGERGNYNAATRAG